MAKIQCKMCGGTVELPLGVTAGECPYCGSLTTFPKIADEQTEHLYSRAENFRRRNDFDKAAAAYEAILDVNGEDPEACWGLVLSRYGIEYVEDPVTGERIPTCHRAQFESILADPDYLNALKFASGGARGLYEKEAHRIAEIQKDILRISSQEKPYDVFICYKETTDGGARTKDSILAQDIYYQLADRGLKVFFSRITLEDKLGQQYEPYIFAALNSAKVMLVVGTKREHFEAVWVKNEWSRFLALRKKDRSRLLIPCFRDMDPYDIPEELSMFQCQDMGRIGFIQDVIHGIMKVVNAGKPPAQSPVPLASLVSHAAPAVVPTPPAAPAVVPPPSDAPVVVPTSPDAAPVVLPTSPDAPVSSVLDGPDVSKMMKRISILMQQEEWEEAKVYCKNLLNNDPENAELYLMLCMISHKIPTEERLQKNSSVIVKDKNFQIAMKYSSPERKKQLELIQEKGKRFAKLIFLIRGMVISLSLFIFIDLLIPHKEMVTFLPFIILILVMLCFTKIRSK